MNRDCRCCSNCLNNDDGVCDVSIKEVKPADCCSHWEQDDDFEMELRTRSKKKKPIKMKKHFRND